LRLITSGEGFVSNLFRQPGPGLTYRTRTLFLPDFDFFSSGIESESKYTVPAIHHVPSNTYMMDSTPIAQFIESTYPNPPVPLTSQLGREVETKARAVVSTAFRNSVMPREINILSPRSQEYFRRTREAALGHPLEDLLEKEESSWRSLADEIRAVGELMQTNRDKGPFVLGSRPSYTDFFIAGALQCARMVDEGVFQRNIKYSGYAQIYEACLPYMEKKD
jgi:glutathione S-transferase